MVFYIIICISFIFYVVLESLVKLIVDSVGSFFVNGDIVFFFKFLVDLYIVWFIKELLVVYLMLELYFGFFYF